MAGHNADNERIKRRYFVFLKEAKRQIEDCVDAVAQAVLQAMRGAGLLGGQK